jgi:hypothetical protein
MTQEDKILYMPRAELVKRGWSPKAIKELLGEPDKTEPAKRDPAKTRKFYLISRINQIEASGKLKDYPAREVTKQTPSV